jgi:hypothetical protein
VLFRVGQHAVQCAGDHSLVAHGLAFMVMNNPIRTAFLPSWQHTEIAPDVTEG